MATDIIIPSIGESITSGVVAAWVKADGEYVERDETVLELETDKITMEISAPAAGVLKHNAAEGDEVEVGAVIGQVDQSAQKPAAATAQTGASAATAEAAGSALPETTTPPPAAPPARASVPSQTPAASVAGASSASTNPASTNIDIPAPTGGVPATPLAQRIAQEKNIDLATIVGTGVGGRIREQDVLTYIQTHAGSGSNGVAVAADSPPAQSRNVTRQKMTTLRQRVASRLVEAQQTAAMLTTFNECDMSAVMNLRKRYKEQFTEIYGVGLGFMSFFVKAVSAALEKVPMVNAMIVQGENGKPEIQTHEYCDISIAVASPKGLVVPVIRNAQTLSFAQIESTIKDLAIRAKTGKLILGDLQGGTFTITNGGIFGSLLSTPILNPPQSAILGMHGIKNRVVENPDKPGEVAIRPMMYLAVSYDHRLVDGAEAVTFLVHIKNAIENPERLMLGM